ncbi:MAG: 5-oxoprolinase subunit PxpB [Acidaminococcales bacterium]|nr:5-oxoprolinase subunit PxpB [Acidaminococcales bacterium]
MSFAFKILTTGDRAVAVEFGAAIDEKINARVHLLARFFAGERPCPGIVDIVPTYRSLSLIFDPFVLSKKELCGLIETYIAANRDMFAEASFTRVSHTVKIPVCYGGEFGPDLAAVALHSGLSEDEVVNIHSAVKYKVYMLGFLPGFPYLGGLDERIACPRLKTPRTNVPAGSVGIAASQTGVYPVDSPGGWQLIGRTPQRIFDKNRGKPFMVQPGDMIEFVPVGKEEYNRLLAETAVKKC